jgi:hypothetical protein
MELINWPARLCLRFLMDAIATGIASRAIT